MPSIMIKHNISPETVVSIEDEREGYEIPEIGVKVLKTPGLIPQALQPMRDKRLALKQLLKTIDKTDPRYHSLRHRYKVLALATDRKSVTDALKWIDVVCYGRLGFANATFGRLNAHETVSYLSRKNTMRARSIAASMGFEPKHVYVDSIFVSKVGATTEDFQAVADKIAEQTGLPMDFDGKIYPWFAFLATRENPNISVANRFYGLLSNGDHKIRGIALRPSDSPKFVANIQRSVLEILAKETDPTKLPNLLPEILEMVDAQLGSLKKRDIPLEQLLVTQTLSRDLSKYSAMSALFCAAQQLDIQGKAVRRGQIIRFIYVARGPGVYAWDLPNELDPRAMDVLQYRELAFRAVLEVLQPLGYTERVLRGWILNKASYVMPQDLSNPSQQLAKQELPILADLPFLHLDVVQKNHLSLFLILINPHSGMKTSLSAGFALDGGPPVFLLYAVCMLNFKLQSLILLPVLLVLTLPVTSDIQPGGRSIAAPESEATVLDVAGHLPCTAFEINELEFLTLTLAQNIMTRRLQPCSPILVESPLQPPCHLPVLQWCLPDGSYHNDVW